MKGYASVNEEAKIKSRLMRRLRGERASVMLEFAFVVPLVFVAIVSAADITRILRTEQQLEIAARLTADIESHMVKYSADVECPSREAKKISKYYLRDVAQVVEDVDHVYIKGSCSVVKNPISVAVAAIHDFFDGNVLKKEGESAGSMFVSILGKILGGIANFLTFRTDKYITEVVPHDRAVKVSVAAYVPTVLPASAYTMFGIPTSQKNGYIGVAQMTPDLLSGKAAVGWNQTIDTKNRHRVYCYMPVIDSVPMPPVTYVRKFKQWCANNPILKGLVK